MPKRILVYLSIVLFYLFSFQQYGFSQSINYINYDIRDGLAGSNVYDAVQDMDGFMWFATENGLSRFDGKKFTTFTVKDGLPDNEIIKLFVDYENRLWLLPFKAAVAYYYKGRIFSDKNDSLLRLLKFKTNPFNIVEDKQGNLLISEFTQYHIIYKNKHVKTGITEKEKWITLGPAGINTNGQFQLYVVLPNGMPAIFNPSSSESKSFDNNDNKATMTNALLHPQIIAYPSKNNTLKVTFSNGDTFNIHSAEGNIDYLSNNQLAIARKTGVDLYDLDSKFFLSHLLNEFKINSSFYDKEGNYWFTTNGSGIIMVPSLNFRSFCIVNDSTSLSVSSLASDKSDLFIGSESGQLWHLDFTKKFHLLNKKLTYKVGGRITAVKMLEMRKLIVGSDEGLSSDFPIKIHHPGISLQKQLLLAIKSISIADQGALITSHKNTSLLDLKKDSIQVLREGRATCALQHNSGYYIGTLNGLFFIEKVGKHIYLGDFYDELRSRIIALSTTSEGALWIATKGQGLIEYKNKKIRNVVNEKKGLTSDNCTALYIKEDTIWLGTDKGLNQIFKSNTGEIIIQKYTTIDGLLSNTINAIAKIDNTVYVGDSKGLTLFEVDKNKRHSNCNIVFTGIFINGKYWRYDTTNFSLKHNNNDLRFEFAGISFTSGNDISYHYRLLGLHNDFRTTKDNSINFASLPSGNYILQIYAINGKEVKSITKSIHFRIESPFWENIWIWIAFIVMLLALVIAIFRFRIKAIKKREKEKTRINKRLIELEHVALRSQMNPHFIFNSLNSIQQFVIEKDIQGANAFITDFSNLIRMTLDFAAKGEINISDELFYIETYLKIEKSRLENKFDYSITVDRSISSDIYTLPPLLIQPFVENSIRHGIKNLVDKKGEIKITVECEDDFLIIKVIDNGVGREVSKLFKTSFKINYQSKGVALSRERIASYLNDSRKRGRIEIEDLKTTSGDPLGTRISIYVPQRY